MTIDVPPTLVLDLDGTIADTAADLIGTLNVILGREGVPPVSLAAGRAMVGAGARALIERGFSAAGRRLDAARLDVLFRDFLDHYEEHICDESALFEGFEAAIDRFAAAGWTLAVCTNKIEAPSVKLLDALGVAHRFACICGQDTFRVDGAPVFKPDARALTLTIARAGGDPSAAIMVEDSRTDILTAKNAGVPVVAVDFGYTDTPVSELDPDAVISHFDALWEAVERIRSA